MLDTEKAPEAAQTQNDPRSEVDKMTAHDKCMAAMAIIQMHTGAKNSLLKLREIFGVNPDTALELAAKLLSDLLEPLGALEGRETPNTPDQHTMAKGLSAPSNTAETESPIMVLYRRWRDAYQFANSKVGCEKVWPLDALREIERQVAEEPSRSVADLAAKIIVTTNDDDFDFGENTGPQNPKVWAEIRQLAGGSEPMGQSAPDALFGRWKALREKRSAIIASAGDNDPETPEYAAMEAEGEALAKAIASAQPTTDADAAAMLEWSVADSEGVSICGLNIQAQRAVAAYLRARS